MERERERGGFGFPASMMAGEAVEGKVAEAGPAEDVDCE